MLIVDDSSPDGTAEIAGSHDHVHVITRPETLGIASSYLDGFRVALDLRPAYIYLCQF